MTKKRPIVTWSFPLFQEITYLFIVIQKQRSSLWNKLLNIGKKRIHSISFKNEFFFLAS
jgi:hypothetical protein